jgi:hypothetical protein
LTGIDGGPATQAQDRLQAPDAPLPDVWTALDQEYFVEWQVADVAMLTGSRDRGEVNSL